MKCLKGHKIAVFDLLTPLPPALVVQITQSGNRSLEPVASLASDLSEQATWGAPSHVVEEREV